MICDECETVAHCMKNGCVPKQSEKRTWEELTDEEWLSLGCKSVEEVRIGLAIQAKLKEKNSD